MLSIKPIWQRHWLDEVDERHQWSKDTADYVRDLWVEDLEELTTGQLNLLRRAALRDIYENKEKYLIELVYSNLDDEDNATLNDIIYERLFSVQFNYDSHKSINLLHKSILKGLDQKIYYLMELYKEHKEQQLLQDDGFRD